VGLHVAIDQLRKRKRETLFDPADLERELDASGGDAQSADLLEQHDLEVARRRVQALIESLNPRYALAIRLRVIEERPREAAAEALGVSVATFDVVLHRAMAALKRVMANSGGDSP
jgi:RNA polymerase sigma-70 factor (ECF subfamily)